MYPSHAAVPKVADSRRRKKRGHVAYGPKNTTRPRVSTASRNIDFGRLYLKVSLAELKRGSIPTASRVLHASAVINTSFTIALLSPTQHLILVFSQLTVSGIGPNPFLMSMSGKAYYNSTGRSLTVPVPAVLRVLNPKVELNSDSGRTTDMCQITTLPRTRSKRPARQKCRQLTEES